MGKKPETKLGWNAKPPTGGKEGVNVTNVEEEAKSIKGGK